MYMKKTYLLFALLVTAVSLAAGPAQGRLHDPADTLSPVDRDYYDQTFSYVLSTFKTGENYTWQTYDSSGVITVDREFESASGAHCRRFMESYNIHGKNDRFEGVGCLRKNNSKTASWCRLRVGNPLTCAMEKPGGGGGVSPLDKALQGGANVLSTVTGVDVGTPTIGTPAVSGGGGIDTSGAGNAIGAVGTASGQAVDDVSNSDGAGSVGEWFGDAAGVLTFGQGRMNKGFGR
jgi:hypothetical protein